MVASGIVGGRGQMRQPATMGGRAAWEGAGQSLEEG